VLGYPHPVRRSAHDLRYFIDGQIGEHSKQDHFRVIRRKCRYDQLRGLLRGQLAHHLAFRIVDGRSPLEVLVGDRLRVTAQATAAMIGDSTASDREHPRPKSGRLSFEPVQSGRHGHPHLTSEVIGGSGLTRPKKPQQPGMKLAEQHRYRGVVTGAGGFEQRSEVTFVAHHSSPHRRTIKPSAFGMRT
jgi:hypothetical protein